VPNRPSEIRTRRARASACSVASTWRFSRAQGFGDLEAPAVFAQARIASAHHHDATQLRRETAPAQIDRDADIAGHCAAPCMLAAASAASGLISRSLGHGNELGRRDLPRPDCASAPRLEPVMRPALDEIDQRGTMAAARPF